MTTKLYPKAAPYETGRFSTKDGHQLYFERHGSPSAKNKVVHLHGGPGAGSSFEEHRWFNPDHYDILLFDQRGSGKSTPATGDNVNNIARAIEDIEKLRTYCGYESWNVAGGSWGSALGMLYTAEHPHRVNRLLLRGVFFADRNGAEHIAEEHGAAEKNRNIWFNKYQNYIPEDQRTDGLISAYHEILKPDTLDAIEAARLFTQWDTSIATPEPDTDLIAADEQTPIANLALSRTFFHFSHNEFIHRTRAQLLNRIQKLDTPIYIVHGREDHICPVNNAHTLHNICKNSKLTIVDGAGHAMGQTDLRNAFITTTDTWALQKIPPPHAHPKP